MTKLICVDPKQVDLIWPEVSHWIKAAMDRADLGKFEVVEDDVLNGRALLWLPWVWPDIEGAVVTQLSHSAKSKVCTIVACGGERSSRWLHLISEIEKYAKAEGCDSVRIFGRRGWSRVLKNYKTKRVILERHL